MKKIIILLLVIFFPIMALAKEYIASDINTKINISDEYIVLTRDNLDEDSLNKLNVSKEYLEEVMYNDNIYYIIAKENISNEIIVVVPENKLPFKNLKEVDSKTLSTIEAEFITQTGSDILYDYQNNYYFIFVEYYDEISGYHVINFYTVVNYRGYNFQLQKKTEITETDKQELKKVVDSVTINEYKEVVKEPDNTQKFNKKNIIYAVIIGVFFGIITYFIDVNRRKKKSSK